MIEVRLCPTSARAALALGLVACAACRRSPLPPDDVAGAPPVAPPVAGRAPSKVRAPLPRSSEPPLGLVIVTVDTLRADYLSSYGHARILTPSFDRLAAGGVLFRNAFSQATTTTPSHASLFTGLYLQDHNVYSNFEALGDKPKTLAEQFYGRGYGTFALVNMKHLNPEVGNVCQGFETVVKSGNMRRAGPSIDQFLTWLDERGEKPFFAWLHMADVHTPYHPPPPYDRFYYDGDERDPQQRSLQRIWHFLPTNMSDHPLFLQWLEGITDLGWVLAQYQGAVTYVDDELGRLLDALEDRDLLGRVAIIVTADHGEALGEKDMYFVHTGLYEATVHVPLLMYFPGTGRHGINVREVVQHVDVMPTVLDYFDIPTPNGIRGKSLWPLIRGEIEAARIAFIEHAGQNLVALRTDRYKYIRHLRTLHIQPSYPFVAGREELYDLVTDPNERSDLAAQRPELVRVFREELERRRADKQGLATGKAEVTDETVEVLRSLGYVR